MTQITLQNLLHILEYITSSSGKILMLNVYMPCNYGDEDSLDEYIECLSQLHALIVESDAIHTMIAGDFNSAPTSRFFSVVRWLREGEWFNYD